MVRVIARQLSGKNCLAAIFASRHQDASPGPLGLSFFFISGVGEREELSEEVAGRFGHDSGAFRVRFCVRFQAVKV